MRNPLDSFTHWFIHSFNNCPFIDWYINSDGGKHTHINIFLDSAISTRGSTDGKKFT